MHETQSEILKAVLVGLQLPEMSPDETQASLDELARLVTTLGYKPVARLSQRRNTGKGALVLGEGKLKELAAHTGGSGKLVATFKKKLSKAALKFDKNDDEADVEVDEPEDEEYSPADTTEIPKCDVAIFDCDLSPSQLRNLEGALGCPVLDRTGVIIEIFSRHAKTKAARLQVEIARLTYVAPRLRETGGSEDRQGGGVGGKGAGETSLELDKRKIRDRIKELKAELASIASEHDTRRAKRSQEITVALVGYTNAGKSSLMRAITGSEVLVADKLFATLDTTIRPLYPETKPKILISDTVGFIKKLPHDLVASFKSTLDEALNASLLLYVVDSSDPHFRSQLEVTRSVLTEVGVENTPSLLILNKRDLLSESQLNELKVEFPAAIFLSTKDKLDLKMLRSTLIERFEENYLDEEWLVSYAKKGVVGEIRTHLRVLNESHNDKGFIFKVRGSEKELNRIKKKYDL